MKNYLHYLSFAMIIISCNPQQSTEHKIDIASQSVSDFYKPPVFANDNRLEKIKDILPDMQLLIE
ncbi:MAG: hypothetical protein KAI29_15455, partial [Cyclobacteriaceae bacterium]|nr:hypothetical protein [Cyclobacteriaceae bacterium]